jgi:hypothetical protein
MYIICKPVTYICEILSVWVFWRLKTYGQHYINLYLEVFVSGTHGRQEFYVCIHVVETIASFLDS